MPKKEKFFANEAALKAVVSKIPHAEITPRLPSALAKAAAQPNAKVLWLTEFDDATGVLSAILRIGPKSVLLGSTDIESMDDSKERMAALQFLKGAQCLDESHLAAVWRRASSGERRAHETALNIRQRAIVRVAKLKAELQEALAELAVAEREVKATAKALETP